MGNASSSPAVLREHLERAISAFDSFPPAPQPPPEGSPTIASDAAQEAVAAWLTRQGLPADRPLDAAALCSTVWAALSSGPGAAAPPLPGSSREVLANLADRITAELIALPANAEAARDAIETQLGIAGKFVTTEAQIHELIGVADALGATVTAIENRKGAALEAEAAVVEAAQEALAAAQGPVYAALLSRLAPEEVAALHPALAANLAQLGAMLRSLSPAPVEDSVVRLGPAAPPAVPLGAVISAAAAAEDIEAVMGLEQGWAVRPGGVVTFELRLRRDAAGGAPGRGASALSLAPPPAAVALARRLTIAATLEPLAEAGGGRGAPLTPLISPAEGGGGVRVTLRVPPAAQGVVGPRHRVIITAVSVSGVAVPCAPPLPFVIDVLPPGWRREARRVGWGGGGVGGGEPFDDAAACGGADRIRRIASVTMTAGSHFGTPCVLRLAVRYVLHDGREVTCEHGGSGAAAAAPGVERVHATLGSGERVGRVFGSTLPHGLRQIFALGIDVVPATGAAGVLRSFETGGARSPVDTAFSEAGDVIAFAGRAGDVLERIEVIFAGGRVYGEGGNAGLGAAAQTVSSL